MDDQLFAGRKSVRSFRPDPIPRQTIERLLEAAVAAPNAGNCQPWHFYVVQNQKIKERLAECAYGQAFIAEAPVVLVVCAEPQRSAQRYGERGAQLYCLQDTAAAIENILLCAAGSGLGGCWCGAFEEDLVAEALALPGGLRAVTILPLGVPRGFGPKPGRRALKKVVTWLD